MYCYHYPRPAVTTDIIIFKINNLEEKLEILLIERKNEPFAKHWALPGGFIDLNESAEECALRELYEETNIEGINLEQLITASKPGRDPRGHTVSVVFWAIVDFLPNYKEGDDASKANFFPINNLPPLAFDHKEIIDFALKQLKFRTNLAEHFQDFFVQIKSNSINLLKKFFNNA